MSSTQLLTIAEELDYLLSEVIALQRDHVEKVCSTCGTPCCTRVNHLFDEKDLVFAKTLDSNGRPRKKRKGKRGCAYLLLTGCLLEPKARPFTCHRYLCSDLEEEMDRHDPNLVSMLKRKFRAIERLRGELLGEFIQNQGQGGDVPPSSEEET